MKINFKMLLLAALFPACGFAQVGGDYRTVASGAWSTAANWEKYNGVTFVWAPTTSAPTTTANVTIQAGHFMTLSGTSNSYTLTVEAGAGITSDGAGQRGLRVTGGALTNNGIIGGSYGNDSINLEVLTPGATCLISGSGVTKVNRLRAYYGLTNTSIVFDQDAIFNNTGSSGGNAVGLTGYYNSSSGSAAENVTITINAGRTVSLTNSASLHFSSTATTNTGGTYIYNVNGVLDMSTSVGTSNLIPNSINASSIVRLNVAGLAKIGAGLNTVSTSTSSTFGSVQLNVLAGGIVDLSATSALTLGTTEFVMADGTAIMKRVVAATDTSFPVAVAAGGYNTAVLNNSGTVDTFSVKLKNTFDVTLADATKVVNRQWTISEAVAGGSNATIKLAWLTADQASAFNPASGVNIYVVNAGGVQTVYPATVTGAGTIASPYVAVATGVTSFGKVFVGNAGTIVPSNSIPTFTGGATQNLSVCVSSSATSINSLLAVNDADAGQTETWTLLVPPVNGTAVAAYTTTSTGSTLTPTGLTYTPTAAYAGPDSFFVRVSDGTDADTIRILVSVSSTPSAGTISGPSSVCTGAVITLSNAVSGGVWTSSSTAASVSATGVISGVSSGVATISYAVTTGCGTAYATYAVTVNLSAAAAAITGSSSVCVGATIDLADATSGGVWTAVNGAATVSTSGVVTGIAPGVDTIVYTITGVCGSSSATKVVTVAPLPDAGTISGSSVLCTGSFDTLSSSVAGGVWSASNANAGVDTNGVLTPATEGIDTISYTVTSGCGVPAAAVFVVNVSSAPTGTVITGHDTVCQGQVITLSASASGGVWSSTDPSVALASSTGIVGGVTPGTDSIRYIITNGCGSDTAYKKIIVRSAAQCAAGVDDVSAAAGLSIYPNPNSGRFTLSLGAVVTEPVQILVTNMLGQKVAEFKAITNTPKELYLDGAKGVYFITAATTHGSYSAKVLFQ